jgi:hypothetical protein
LIQGGASLTYVKEQMGHSSIQVTVDTYVHLIPGADVNWVDRLDAQTEPQQIATNPQQCRGSKPPIRRKSLIRLVAAVGLEPTT